MRRRNNLVSMRFNMFNWMLEVVSVLLVIIAIGDNPMLTNLHNLVNSCGPPVVFFFKYCLSYSHKYYFFLVYFLGIEENRRLACSHVQTQMRMFTRKKVAADNTNDTSLESNSN